MAKVDYEYETTEERVRAYLKVPEIDRLRWLEELCVFTKMARAAPVIHAAGRTKSMTSLDGGLKEKGGRRKDVG